MSNEKVMTIHLIRDLVSRKITQKKIRIEKVIRRKGNKLYVK